MKRSFIVIIVLFCSSTFALWAQLSCSAVTYYNAKNERIDPNNTLTGDQYATVVIDNAGSTPQLITYNFVSYKNGTQTGKESIVEQIEAKGNKTLSLRLNTATDGERLEAIVYDATISVVPINNLVISTFKNLRTANKEGFVEYSAQYMANVKPKKENGITDAELANDAPSQCAYSSYFRSDFSNSGDRSLTYIITPEVSSGTYRIKFQYYIASNYVLTPTMTVNGDTVFKGVKNVITSSSIICTKTTDTFTYNNTPLTIKLSTPIAPIANVGGSGGDRIRLIYVQLVPVDQTSPFTSQDNIVLQDNFQKIVFTSKGKLLTIQNKESGYYSISEGQVSSFPLSFSYFDEGKSDISAISFDSYLLENNRLILNYSAGSVKFICNISLLDDGKSSWNLSIENLSDQMVLNPKYPIIENLTAPQDSYLYWPFMAGRRVVDPTKNLPDGNIMYGGTGSMQWLLLENSNESFYFGSHDQTLLDTELRTSVNETGKLTLCMTKYARILPREKWQSEPFIISAYTGDWHKGANIYSTWVHTWLKPISNPNWWKDESGMIEKKLKWAISGTWEPSVEQDIQNYFKDIPALFESGPLAKGVSGLWLSGQMYRGNCYRYYALDPDLGTEQEFIDKITEVRAKGGHVSVYTNGMNWDPNFPENMPMKYLGKVNTVVPGIADWKAFSEKNATRDFDGVANVQYPGRWDFYIMDSNTNDWMNYMKYWIADKYVTEYKTDVIQIDQIGCTYYGANYNYAVGNRHHGSNATGYDKLLREVTTSPKAANPNTTFFIEGMADIYGQYVNNMGVWPGGYFTQTDAFPQLYHYCFPEHIIRGNTNNHAMEKLSFLAGLKNASAGTHFTNVTKILSNTYYNSKFIDNKGLGAVPLGVNATLFECENHSGFVIAFTDDRSSKTTFNINLSGALFDLSGINYVYFYKGQDGSKVTTPFVKDSNGNISITIQNMGSSLAYAVSLGKEIIKKLSITSPATLTTNTKGIVNVKALTTTTTSGTTTEENAAGVTITLGDKSYTTDADGNVEVEIGPYSGKYILTAKKIGMEGARTIISAQKATSIDDLKSNNNFFTYLSKDGNQLFLKDIQSIETVTIDIYNSIGQLTLSVYQPQTQPIYVGKLPSGIYIVHVNNQSKKFIKW